MNLFTLGCSTGFSRAVTSITALALVVVALPQVSLAAPATLAVAPAQLELEIGAKGNFVVTQQISDFNTDEFGNRIRLTDRSGTGTFFNGNLAGECNSDTPDNLHSINLNKAVCYSNATAGEYNLLVESFASDNEAVIIASTTVTVTVVAADSDQDAEAEVETEVEVPTSPAASTSATATATDNASSTSSTTDTEQASSTPDVATSTPSDNASTSATATSTPDTNTASTSDPDTTTATSTASTDSEHPAVASECEFEAHKYNQFGVPLAGWTIGLMKRVTHKEGTDVYTLDEEVTDTDGYVCLQWDGYARRSFDGSTSTYIGGDFDFTFWIYERMQDGWTLNSIEEGPAGDSLRVVSGDEIIYGDHLARVQHGEETVLFGFNTAHHYDFYNKNEDATTTGTSTVGGGGGGCCDDDDDEETTSGSNDGGDSTSTRTSRGSRNGGTRTSDPQPLVAGVSDSDPTQGVGGDQVSAIPLGAPNTGAGGASTNTALAILTLLTLLALLGFSRRINA